MTFPCDESLHPTWSKVPECNQLSWARQRGLNKSIWSPQSNTICMSLTNTVLFLWPVGCLAVKPLCLFWQPSPHKFSSIRRFQAEATFPVITLDLAEARIWSRSERTVKLLPNYPSADREWKLAFCSYVSCGRKDKTWPGIKSVQGGPGNIVFTKQ